MTRARILVLFAALALVPTTVQAQAVTLTLDETVLAPKTRLGIGVNGGGGWTNFVGAILVDDPSFEGAADGNGFAQNGWPWYTGGTVTASVDTADKVTGAQSQRVVVTGVPAHMSQGRAELPQAPLTMTARVGHTYRIKVQARSDTTGARIRLGVVNDSWGRDLGPDLPLTTSWQVYQWDYSPSSDHLLRGIAIGFTDTATYWLDDLVAWDVDDIDTATGLAATFVQRLIDLAPATLRLGGLGVNGIPLESYLRPGWDLGYGPPALQPDLDLNTFLRLCQRVGAQPFITVPPAFSDATGWQLGDLSDDVIANRYVDHGNLVDYLGGGTGTVYGQRRESDGHTRWDLVFDAIYFELGNELWGTPDNHWDMDPNNNENQAAQMQNYAIYCERRATEMKGRPGWRANMRVGFGGRSPTMWMGGWNGSYDGTLVPAIGSLVDFSTIDLYYGAGAATDSNTTIYAALFAHAPKYEREITAMKAAFYTANGDVDLPTMVYEGNATWGGYESNLGSPSALYFKSVSLGAAVSLIDVYAASNRAGLVVNNHFHYGGNVWGATGSYPAVLRKPAYYALQLFNRHLAGDLVTCSVGASTSYDETLTGETGVPHVACYPYRNGQTWTLLVVNRHLSEARTVHVARRFAPVRRILLTGSDPAQNNESSEVVQLQETTLGGELVDTLDEIVPPFSALVLVLSELAVGPGDAGAGSDAGTPSVDASTPDSFSDSDASTQDSFSGSDAVGPGSDAGTGIPDVSSRPDPSSSSDVVDPTDAGDRGDGAATADATVSPVDAAVDAQGMDRAESRVGQEGGCACSSTGANAMTSGLALLTAMLWVVRRRRERREPRS